MEGDVCERVPPARWSFVVLAALVMMGGSSSVQGQLAPSRPILDELEGLAGCWQLRWDGGAIDEQWMRPAAGLMMGMSRTVRSGRVIETERLVIRETDDGLEYVADPSGQRETVFVATVFGDSEWIFSNQEHDFPQRIAYRVSAEHLAAYIEGEQGGETRRIEFPMVRVSCVPEAAR